MAPSSVPLKAKFSSISDLQDTEAYQPSHMMFSSSDPALQRLKVTEFVQTNNEDWTHATSHNELVTPSPTVREQGKNQQVISMPIGIMEDTTEIIPQKKMKKLLRKQMHSKLINGDQLADEYDDDMSLDKTESSDSLRTVGSTEQKNPSQIYCVNHPDMVALCKCHVCGTDICGKCRNESEGVAHSIKVLLHSKDTSIVCNNCWEEHSREVNMVWLFIGAILLGVIFPPLLVGAPVICLLRTKNPSTRKIGWILFWVTLFGVLFLGIMAFVAVVVLKSFGKI